MQPTDELADLDWIADFGLTGSENVLSAFVAWALREHVPLRSWLLEKATLDPARADHEDWRVVREWFVGGAGNVDILVRNRALGWTFVIEHKIATRLSEGQLKKYVQPIAEARRCSGRKEIVLPCLLTPSGEPHKLDLAHGGLCTDAIQLDYSSFVERARAIPAILGRHAARCCLNEMERLVSAPRSTVTPDRRDQLLAAIAERLGDGAKREGISVKIDDCTITIPNGARQCVSIKFEQPVAGTDGASAILDGAVKWAQRHGRERVSVSVPWPEPGADAPWATELAPDEADELIEEQAAVVEQIVRAAGRPVDLQR